MKFILGKYFYPNYIYTGYHSKFNIECPLHGLFEKTLAMHLDKRRPQGCPECSKIDKAESAKIYYDINQIREIGNKVFNNLYTYPDQEPIVAHDKVKIICSVHRRIRTNIL